LKVKPAASSALASVPVSVKLSGWPGTPAASPLMPATGSALATVRVVLVVTVSAPSVTDSETT
jgi:hypothetical protein